MDDQTITELHFGVSASEYSKPTPPGSLHWKIDSDNSTPYCSLGSKSCLIPLEEVLTVLGKTIEQLCDLMVYVGAHVKRSDGETCWPDDDPSMASCGSCGSIQAWGDQFTMKFSCTDGQTCCCCAAPPSLKYKCDEQTAYAKDGSSECLIDTTRTAADKCGNNWGFDIKSSGSFEAPLIAGAGKCLGGTPRGTVKVTTADGCFDFAFTADPGYGIGKAQVNIGCVVPYSTDLSKGGLGRSCTTPGKFVQLNSCNVPTASNPAHLCPPTACSGATDFYFVIHTETYALLDAKADGSPACSPEYTCS
ncbi:hypothetical protein B0I35DRAFT_447563 [Stachybotrys elegans]|uniref:Uncharacterized protein n=1 Tax=Stachybotrys elegans TaxID=80388 RepID=A0A8K0SAT9_9HYPO|nr:hypothetical protein B0I35DRAFT_447563 [Stachybotrys elegans]